MIVLNCLRRNHCGSYATSEEHGCRVGRSVSFTILLALTRSGGSGACWFCNTLYDGRLADVDRAGSAVSAGAPVDLDSE
ncbi:MAG: hypothetical protein J07HQW1_03583 [Haloquadratum walsbyi J07HQW1]|uniref:Uncharacterized protein n=1 Tax=Haloquadratum walsbyi J07HQW1 TaxID=1238424 RepID=U1MTD5_9EURY|nr:MAG: hypothetical protein J07HQW1_03583 [Haloquadratum walsbyi J07HQW1]